MKPSLTDEQTAVMRIEIEARAMAARSDPHLVIIDDVGTLGGSALGASERAGPFIAMELVDGENLAASRRDAVATPVAVG